jgi:hypothetical protein
MIGRARPPHFLTGRGLNLQDEGNTTMQMGRNGQ